MPSGAGRVSCLYRLGQVLMKDVAIVEVGSATHVRDVEALGHGAGCSFMELGSVPRMYASAKARIRARNSREVS